MPGDRFPLWYHQWAVEQFLSEVSTKRLHGGPVGLTRRGYRFSTEPPDDADQQVDIKHHHKPVEVPEEREEPAMATTESITSKDEVTQDLVNGWIDSYATKGDKGRMDWKAITENVHKNHGVILPAENRHPVATKVQRMFRAIVLNDMQPVIKPAKPAPEVEGAETSAE